MRPYGIKHVGPVCGWGCCWRYTPQTSPPRACRYGAGVATRRAHKRRARAEGRRAERERGE